MPSIFSFNPLHAIDDPYPIGALIPKSRFSFTTSGDLASYPEALKEVIDVFRKYYHLPDCSPLLAALAAVVGHQIAGSPIWLMLIGPASCGKTAIIESLTGLPDTQHAASISLASLLSGTSKREQIVGSTGGLLSGKDSLVLLLKEFSSILSLPRDPRGLLLTAFREIYDGRWSRDLAVDGGRSIPWKGRMSLVTGCTPTIDSFHPVIGSMGERMLFYRFPRVNPSAIANKVANRTTGKSFDETAIQEATKKAVNHLYASLPGTRDGRPPKRVPSLTPNEHRRLVGMALVCCQCRSVVERDPYSHDVTNISDPETPGRYTGASIQLHAGLKALGVPIKDRWKILGKIALDSMPAIRRKVVDTLTANYQTPLTTTTISSTVFGYSEATVRRVLEDLAILGVAQHSDIDHNSGQSGKPGFLWQLTENAVSDFRQAFPQEMEDIDMDIDAEAEASLNRRVVAVNGNGNSNWHSNGSLNGVTILSNNGVNGINVTHNGNGNGNGNVNSNGSGSGKREASPAEPITSTDLAPTPTQVVVIN